MHGRRIRGPLPCRQACVGWRGCERGRHYTSIDRQGKGEDKRKGEWVSCGTQESAPKSASSSIGSSFDPPQVLVPLPPSRYLLPATSRLLPPASAPPFLGPAALVARPLQNAIFDQDVMDCATVSQHILTHTSHARIFLLSPSLSFSLSLFLPLSLSPSLSFSVCPPLRSAAMLGTETVGIMMQHNTRWEQAAVTDQTLALSAFSTKKHRQHSCVPRL